MESSWWLGCIFIIYASLALARRLLIRNKRVPEKPAVFITGCDSGIGRHLAVQLDSLGCEVFAGCLRPTLEGDEAPKGESPFPSTIHVVPLDVTSEKSVTKAVQVISSELRQKGKELWCLVNNAGVCIWGEFGWQTWTQIEQQVKVNLFGTFLVTRHFLPLIRKAKGALKRMMNFNQPASKVTAAEPVWKVLIYDRYGQDIISPLLSVKDLRDMGVTLHLLLHSDREPIPDVPAVYFIMPNEENISRISQDFRNQLYDNYYLNFISPISRQKLEDLASSAIHSGCVNAVSKVFDQYLNFITLEDDMFILRHQDRSSMNYYAVNRGDVKDTEMEAIIDSIVDSLFSVFVTLGIVPIIRCPRGNAAEMVAEKLDKKIRENLRDSRNSLFSTDVIPTGPFGFQRPLLVILDRNQDIATPLHHTWTYQALAHDVLDLQLNRVSLEETIEKSSHTGARPRKKIKTFDLSAGDKFWMQYKGSPFPTVAEAVQEELDSYRSSEEEVKRLKSAMGLESDSAADEAIGMVSDNTAKLTSAVSSLPELLEKKRLIDMHMTIATGILDHIKSRKLDIYFEIEEKIMGKAVLEKSLMDMITDPEAGAPPDKLRLFLISFICGPTMTDAEVDQYVTALNDAGCDTKAVNYLKRWKTYSKLASSVNQYSGGTKTVSMFSKLMSHGSQLVMEGVKNLVVKKHNLPITRIVDSLMEMKSLQETDDYRFFDPKMLRVTDSTTVPRNRSPFQDAIAFVIGGGNYIEYQNLIDYTKGKVSPASKKIIYGCTDLVNADQFLKQLSHLGEEIH